MKINPNPSVRLAFFRGDLTYDVLPPSILVSYWYHKVFQKVQAESYYRDWVMDSGAFSAHNSGAEISVREYIAVAASLLDTDPKLKEVFALDVIGDHKASLRNVEKMWEHGVPAIPCYHYGEPWDVLETMARLYPKIALGGVARKKDELKVAWAGECFRRVWPKKIHGFGMAGESLVFGFPFHSVDSTSWEMGPLAFGSWKKFGPMDVREKDCPGGKCDLRSQIKYFLDMESKARVRWSKDMAMLEELEKKD